MANAHPSNAIMLLERDHKVMAARWDALSRALDRAADRRAVRDCIQGLIHCAQEHFQNEEWAMRELAFPDYVKHKAEHRRLLDEADDMLRNFDITFNEGDWSALGVYFRHWLSSHHKRFDNSLHSHARRMKKGA